jgi:predicted DNA-binding transcriptional regulator AlpA
VDDPRQDHPTAPAPAATGPPEDAELPEGVKPLAAVLRELAGILPGLRLALEHQARAPVPRLAYRLDELADSLGMSRRAIERERSAGRFPAPDLRFGKAPLWRPETIRDWLDSRKGVNR